MRHAAVSWSQYMTGTLLKSLIKTGTTVISDCRKSYEKLSERGYDPLTVNHSLKFVDSETGVHTATIKVTWRQFKASLLD
ncbi:hypothetical protein TNCV_2242261 [Trichonephila clavipes]|nr:hypothetical protein TNCV_2242261 [Trichonephila clavipes]